MKTDVEGPCGDVVRIDAVRQVVMMRAILGREAEVREKTCLLYTSPSPRDATLSRMPSSA